MSVYYKVWFTYSILLEDINSKLVVRFLKDFVELSVVAGPLLSVFLILLTSAFCSSAATERIFI